MSSDSIIQIDNVTVHYGKKMVLDHISIRVDQGEIFGFLGPNGAGKTTTIKALLGLVFPTSGTVQVNGYDASSVYARAKLGFLPEEASYYRFLSPVEILTFYGRVFNISKRNLKKRISELLSLVGLDAVARNRLSTFSKGMIQKVGLAQALINNPDVLILDEPTSGLDPLARMELRKILEDLNNQGKTLFISSHELSEIELICHSMAIIKSGQIIESGDLKEILRPSGEQSLERFFLKTIQEDKP
jgi:ABC-2 type transport system ATP-binding protein